MTDASVLSGGGFDDATPASLLDRVRAREEVAWRRLEQLYEPLVRCWCRYAGLQNADADNVWQEVLKALAHGVAEFERGKHGAFRAWLRSIANSKICDHFRQKEREPTGQGGSDALEHLAQLPTAAETTPVAAEDEVAVLYRRALQVILCDFDDKSGQAFLRIVVEGEEPEKVAAELGLTRNVVYLAKSRILRRLREEFCELIDD